MRDVLFLLFICAQVEHPNVFYSFFMTLSNNFHTFLKKRFDKRQNINIMGMKIS